MIYYLCVLDFEATCWKNSANKDQMEIIEFPSVLYRIDEGEETIEFISEFHCYVRPTINPILSDFCTELTGITQEMVNPAETFDIVYAKHIKWLQTNVPFGSVFLFATCGKWDLMTQLPREIKNKGLKKNKFYSKYINVKYELENFYKAKVTSMPSMLRFLGLTLDGRHHSGKDDTRNIAKAMLKMISDGLLYENFSILKV